MTSAARGDASRRRLLRGALALAGGVCLPAHAIEPTPQAGVDARALPRAPDGAAPVASGSRQRFAFALIGDIPYGALEARMLEQVYASFDRDIAFVVHVGDLKAGFERCDDALLSSRHALLDACPLPLVFVPGDNDWADCARRLAGGFDPRERLDWLRRRFFSQPRALGGRPASIAHTPAGLERQADRRPDGLPENLRWHHGGAAFVTLNLPGSNNGLNAAGLDPADMQRREQLNAAWLIETYAMADREALAAVAVIAHANPRFDRDRGAAAARRRDGYAAFRRLLRRSSERFAGTTLFAHGDTHWHGVEALSPKLLRVEAHGSPFSDQWLRIDVDPASRRPFSIVSRRLSEERPIQ